MGTRRPFLASEQTELKSKCGGREGARVGKKKKPPSQRRFNKVKIKEEIERRTR